MEAVRELLRQRVLQDPDNSELCLALENLEKLRINDTHDTLAAIELLTDLETRGLWGTNAAEREVLSALRSAGESANAGSNRFTLVVPPPAARDGAAMWRTEGGHAVLLPPELAEQLNHVAFLHTLATSPKRVIPPGKTLRAALAGADAQRALRTSNSASSEPEGVSQPTVTLQEKVEEIVHRAFWDEARESLASPTPSQQVARLKRLYADLHEVLSRSPPLLPSTHPALITLGAPLSPTPAPLQSTRRHLISVAAALRERCAPVRDDALDAVIAELEGENGRRRIKPKTDAGPGEVDENEDLAARIIDAFRGLLRVADLMRADLSSAVLTRVSDDELVTEIARSAQESERSAVINLCGLSTIRTRWLRWVTELRAGIVGERSAPAGEEDTRWMARLVQALGEDIPVECPLPDSDPPPPSTSSVDVTQSTRANHVDADAGAVETAQDTGTPNTSDTNALPPPFLFASGDLLRLQNRLQALVIAAVLRTLVPLGPGARIITTNEHADAGDRPFAERVLTLLMSEVDEDSPDAGTTKLAHLADEVVREHRRLADASSPASPTSSQSASGPDEAALRSRVDSLLRASSPVFALLRTRLLRTLADSLTAAALSAAATQRKRAERRAPEVMQTGRDRKRLRPDPAVSGFLSSTSVHESGISSAEGWHGALAQAIDSELKEPIAVEGGPVNAALRRLKGYDEPALQKGVREALFELANVVDWVRETWGGALGLKSGESSSSTVSVDDRARS